jgi:hypothetical protein
MSKTGLSKVYIYSLIIVSTALAVNRATQLPRHDAWFGLVIFGATILFFFLPLAVFGASAEPGEKGLKVSQYKDVTLDYSEISGCYRYIVPPFEMVIIITKRRFPLRVLLAGEGVIGRPRGLMKTIQDRTKAR